MTNVRHLNFKNNSTLLTTMNLFDHYDGLIAQLVEHYAGIAEVMDSNLVQV